MHGAMASGTSQGQRRDLQSKSYAGARTSSPPLSGYVSEQPRCEWSHGVKSRDPHADVSRLALRRSEKIFSDRGFSHGVCWFIRSFRDLRVPLWSSSGLWSRNPWVHNMQADPLTDRQRQLRFLSNYIFFDGAPWSRTRGLREARRSEALSISPS